MLVYVPNLDYLRSIDGIAQEPIIWMWHNLSSKNHGWTAATYLITFIINALVSVVELFGWSFMAAGYGTACFWKFYVSEIAYWI